jgi:small subunit ribosomal protein S20
LSFSLGLVDILGDPMPHTRSAKKNQRKTEKRRLHNRAAKKAIKTQIKKVLEVAQVASPEDLQKEYNLAAKKLDKAASRRVIHPNLAARKKSQLAKLVDTKEAAAKTAPG